MQALSRYHASTYLRQACHRCLLGLVQYPGTLEWCSCGWRRVAMQHDSPCMHLEEWLWNVLALGKRIPETGVAALCHQTYARLEQGHAQQQPQFELVSLKRRASSQDVLLSCFQSNPVAYAKMRSSSRKKGVGVGISLPHRMLAWPS